VRVLDAFLERERLRRTIDLATDTGQMTLDQVIEDFQPGFASGEKHVAGGVPHLRVNNMV